MSFSQHFPDLDNPFCPPGTVLLTETNTATESTEINLEPKPTNDPNDPLNWTMTRKCVNFFLALTVTVIFFTTMSIQSIFWQLYVVDFNVEYSDLNKTYAVNLVGTAVGCVIFIPFAQKYGRRPIYVLTGLIYVVTNIWSAKMTTLAEIYATNLIQGLAGATIETIVQMTIADIFFVHHRGTANTLYIMMVTTGVCLPFRILLLNLNLLTFELQSQSFLSPIFAGYMAEAIGWRNCYWVLSAFTAANWLTIVFFFEESKLHLPLIPGSEPQETSPDHTSSPDQLADALDDTDGNKSIDPSMATGKDVPETAQRISSHSIDPAIPLKGYRWRMRMVTKSDTRLLTLFYRPFIVLVSFPAITYTALQYAFALCWISVMSTVISQYMALPPYNFGTGAIGLMSLAPFIGSIFGSLYGGVLADWVIIRLARRNEGYYEPEMRLQLMHLPAFIMPAGILIFGITLAEGKHWIWPSVGGVLFGFGLGSISDNALTLAIDSYRDITGEAFTGIAFLRNTFSIALIFALSPWVKTQGLKNMFITDTLWCWAICMLYLPLLIWGKRIRARTASHYRMLVASRSSER